MTDFITQGLGNVAVYNPALLNDEELAKYFVVRKQTLQRIINGIKKEQPNIPAQHQLILGLRGMGKSTLLRRIALAVREDEQLAQTWLPLSFPEEQYNIKTLKDLWLNCLDALGDILEMQGHSQEVEKLDALIERHADDDAEELLKVLIEVAKQQQRRFVMLIDNIDLVFKRLAKEHWILREILQAHSEIMFIGTSAQAIEATFDYDAAFYDFFKIWQLKPLTQEETTQVLSNLATQQNMPKVQKVIDEQPARIYTLHALTGGNPRTTVLLYKVISQGLDGDVRSDLEGLLDLVTPLYKARFEELPDAAQQLVDAIALHWDPISAKDLSNKLGISVNNISAQLNRLETLAVIQKVPPPTGKRFLFQISERFFNIWYLMRASRRVRKKLIWLVYFLKVFFSSQELKQFGKKQLNSVKSGVDDANTRDIELKLALAQTLEGPMRSALEQDAIFSLYSGNKHNGSTRSVKKRTLRQNPDQLFDFSGEDKPLVDRVERVKQLAQLRAQFIEIYQHEALEQGDELEELVELFVGCPDFDIEQKNNALRLMESREKRIALIQTFKQRYIYWQSFAGALAEVVYKSVAQGYMNDKFDAKGPVVAGIKFDCHSLSYIMLANLLYNQRTEVDFNIKGTILESLINAASNEAWPYLALYQYQLSIGDEQAYQHLLLAQRKEPINPLVQLSLAKWHQKTGDIEQAIAICSNTTKQIPAYAAAWQQLALLSFLYKQDYEMAECGFLEAIKLDASRTYAYLYLAYLYYYQLSNSDKAIAVLQQVKAIGIDDVKLHYLYAIIEQQRGNFALAEDYFVKGDLLASNDIDKTLDFLRLLVIGNHFSEFQGIFKRLISLSPENIPDDFWRNLSTIIGIVIKNYNVKELLECFDINNLNPFWRPLYQALVCVEAGNTDSLNGVAPEFHQPILSLIEQFGGLEPKIERL